MNPHCRCQIQAGESPVETEPVQHGFRCVLATHSRTPLKSLASNVRLGCAPFPRLSVLDAVTPTLAQRRR
jgi:hypothetical protein